jgi:NADPH:quinone reductase-like Zn-dependent oxidoreductase
MKSIVIRHPGQGLEAWKLVEQPEPSSRLASHEVLVRLRAASLNYRDLMVARGHYGGPVKQDLIPLADGAGEVVAVGAGVTRLGPGDRVATSYFPTWQGGPMRADYHQTSGGTYANEGVLTELTVRAEAGLVKVPDHLSFEEASTLPCAGVTAWHTLMEPSPRHDPGATVLVLGSGGVSLFAAQFAHAAGLRVIATTSNADKARRLRALGVDEVIDYHATPEWQREVLRLTGGEGVDHVVEVGGAGTLPRSFEATKVGGTVSLIGMLTGVAAEVNPLPVLFRSLRFQGLSVGSVPMFEAMNRALARHRIAPVVDEVFPLERATAALARMEAGAHFGKIVIRIG